SLNSSGPQALPWARVRTAHALTAFKQARNSLNACFLSSATSLSAWRRDWWTAWLRRRYRLLADLYASSRLAGVASVRKAAKVANRSLVSPMALKGFRIVSVAMIE